MLLLRQAQNILNVGNLHNQKVVKNAQVFQCKLKIQLNIESINTNKNKKHKTCQKPNFG